jgi:hypothetical protein
MKLKEEAWAHGGCRSSEKKLIYHELSYIVGK